MGNAEALVDAYGAASDGVREQMVQLSPLVTEALALLNRGGQNPLHGPIPALTTLTNDLGTEQQDVSWRVDFLHSSDAQPLGPTGRVRAFIPADLESAFTQTGLTPEQVELAKEMMDDGVSFDHAAEAARSSNPEAALDRLKLAELDEQIENWSGSDNDPILDALIAQRNDIEQRQADRQREQNDLWAAFRRQEAEAWSTPELTPLEEAEHALDEIRDILDTAKQDRGDGIGSANADGVWSTNDLQAMIENEHGYYTDEQVEYARTVLAMAESSGDAQSHLGITQSGGGWSFSDIGHLTLDIFGMVPVVGNAADGINAPWYLAEGDHLNAAISSIALIPGFGQAVTAAKGAVVAALGATAFRSLDEALVAVRELLERWGILGRSVDDTGSTVYRVQGGTPPQASVERIRISPEGNMIVDGDEMLFVTFDDLGRAQAYVANNRSGAQIVAFDVDPSFVQQVRDNAVPQEAGRQFRGSPQIADPTRTDSSFGLPTEWINELVASSVEGSGRIVQ